MRLKDILSLSVQTVRPEVTLREAAAMMRASGHTVLPVVDGERVVGVLSDRDIVLRATARGLDPMLARVRDVMSREVAYAYDDQDVEDAIALMQQRRIQQLVVLDHERRIVGAVGVAAVMAHSHNRKLSGRVLERTQRRQADQLLH
jgi:CBS domain-containing protein